MSAEFHSNPDIYAERIRAQVPVFDQLQAEAVAAIPVAPERVLDLGIGTGRTSRQIIEAHPGAQITGLDSDPDMVFRARGLVADVRLARMQDPLPDGPWDLVIAVLSIHALDAGQRQDLFRRVRGQSSALVIGDIIEGDPSDLAAECGGEVVWSADDLAVIRANYP